MKRQSAQERQREYERQVAEQRARQAREEAARALGAFIMDADAHRLALIEQFGVSALRAQTAANDAAYADEVRREQQRVFADALKLAQGAPAPRFRIVLYTEERDRWCGHNPLGGPCEPRVYDQRSPEVRRRQAERELRKLGIPVVEYVNPNANGDGA